MKIVTRLVNPRPELTFLTALLALTAPVGAVTVVETFDGYTNGTDLTAIGGGGVWTPTAGYTVVDGGGVAGSKGLSSASSIFNWKAQSFVWSTLAAGTKVSMALDFQTSSAGKFDDDRVGWTTNADSATSTGNQLALQLDNTGETGMVVYWNSTRTNLNTLSGILASTWYRFNVEFTKLTDTSAGIQGMLTQLDGSGNLIGTSYVGTVPDTSTFSNPAPTTLFTNSATQWPTYKNYSVTGGNADNATFGITVVPEVSSMALLSLLGLPLALWRRRN